MTLFHPVAFSSVAHDWETPRALFAALALEFGPFDVDVAANIENAKCATWYGIDQDGLSQQWRGRCWMNPPYGGAIGKWTSKAASEASSGNCVVVALLPARTDTEWWHLTVQPILDGISPGQVRFLKGRVEFRKRDMKKNRAPYPSVVVVFGLHGNAAGIARALLDKK